MNKSIILILLLITINNVFPQSENVGVNSYKLSLFLEGFTVKGSIVDGVPDGYWRRMDQGKEYYLKFKRKKETYSIDFSIINNDAIFKKIIIITSSNVSNYKMFLYDLIVENCSDLFKNFETYSISHDTITVKKKEYYRDLTENRKINNYKLSSISTDDNDVKYFYDKIDERYLRDGFTLKNILTIKENKKELITLDTTYSDQLSSCLYCNIYQSKNVTTTHLSSNDEIDYIVFRDKLVLVKGKLNSKFEKTGDWFYNYFCVNNLAELDNDICGSLLIEYDKDVLNGRVTFFNEDKYIILMGTMEKGKPIGTWIGENKNKYRIEK